MQFLSEIWPILPEIILVISVLILLMAGVFQGSKNTQRLTYTSVLALLVASLATMVKPETANSFAITGFLIQNILTDYMQVLVYLTSALVLLVIYRQMENDKINHFELPILILLSTLGMALMIASSDFMMFFVGLELQALPVYVMVAMRRNDTIVSEAAVKYFILGALSTVFILYGISFLYGYLGTTEFSGIAIGLRDVELASWPMVLAMVLLLSGIAFKLSVAPFHMWTPDVYEGSPTAVTLFIATAPKVAAMVFFIRLLYVPLLEFVGYWQPMVQALAVLSMAVGVFAALFQVNIKRLLAYSTVANMGYMLVGLASVSIEGVQSVLIYMVIYVTMTVGAFACLMNLRRHGVMPQNIDDLKGLSQTHPQIAMALAILMFSLAGIPPLAGFFAKLFVFMAAVDAGLYLLVVFGLLTTVVGAAYYLRLIKVMYFDAPVGGDAELSYDKGVSIEASTIIAAVAVINVFYFIIPGPLVAKAAEAASVLFIR